MERQKSFIQNSSIQYKIYLPIALVGVIIIAVTTYSLYTGYQMAARYTPLVGAAMEIKLEAALGHLWFEEIISGDRHETLESVLEHYDQADWYVNAMLQGGQNQEGKFIPLKNKKLQDQIKQVKDKLIEFRKITYQRWDLKQEGGIGTDIDQRYDALFMDFLQQADEVETTLQKTITAKLKTFKRLQISMIATIAVVAAIVAAFFAKFTRNQINDRLRLAITNEELIQGKKQLQALNRHLEENELELKSKNEELQSIIYITSHDLKTPLININGFAGELAKSCEQLKAVVKKQISDKTIKQQTDTLFEDYIPESFAFIDSATNKMENLLKGILKVSHVGSSPINPRTLDMNMMLQKICEVKKLQNISEDVDISIDELPNCFADANQINHVFSNLIDNALKYFDTSRKDTIKITGQIKEEKSIYCIEDNGIGIDPEHQKNIFEIFHRLNPDDSTKGQGIGLTIAARILSRNKGKIWLESQPDKGSKFFVSLPKKRDD